MALSDWLTKDNIKVLDNVSHWKDTVALTGEILVNNGTIDPKYIQSIYKNQEELGHYYVLGPSVAMPHSRPEAGVYKIGLSLLIVKNGVYFNVGENDPIQVIFMLAATDSNSHIKMIQEIAELCSNDLYFEQIKKIQNEDELLSVIHEFDSANDIRIIQDENKKIKLKNHLLGKKVVLVNGIPASGKSSIVKLLSEKMGWTILSLDGIKNPFLKRLDGVDREFNRTLGKASYEALWEIVANAPDGNNFIIDAWFGFQSKELLEEYIKYAKISDLVEIWCQISSDEVVKRYESRIKSRLPGHPGKEYIPELKKLAEQAVPMSVSPVYLIEKSNSIDIDDILIWINKEFS